MPNTPQHTLVPVDVSRHATLALEAAEGVAHKCQADLAVVYVMPLPLDIAMSCFLQQLLNQKLHRSIPSSSGSWLPSCS